MKLFFRRCLPSVFFLLCGIGAPAIYGQALIHGNVKNTDGMPIPGVNVQLAGTTLGTTTDFDGDFQLVAEAQDSLVVSYMGYVSQQLPVGTQTEFEIILQEDEQSLGELVINAGYYTTTERERTGNIAKVTAEEIELQPVTNPLEALQGRMAGVEVVQETGIPGAAPRIKIRGQNSLRNSFGNNGNLPLYIVDGMPLNSTPLDSQNLLLASTGTDPLNTLNLSNIKSIEVLKDADATAIYGSRGANGVILITTKDGEAGQHGIQVGVKLYTGQSKVGHFVDLLHTPAYLQLRRQAFENDGVEATEVNAYDLLLWDQDRYTNWQKELFGKTASFTHMDMNVSGNNESTSYRVGGAYQQQGTVFPGDFSYEKKTFNLSLRHHSQDRKFQLQLSTNYGIDKNDLFSSSTLVSSAFSLPPNAPELYTEDGTLNWENSTWNNPLAGLKAKGITKVNNLIGNLGLEYQLVPGLSLKTNLGYTHLTSEETIKQPREIYDPATWDRVSNRSQHGKVTRDSWIVEPQLAYHKKLGAHQLNALVGGTFQENTNTNLRLTGTGYSNSHLIGNLGAADEVTVSNHTNINYKYNAVFARLGYNWKHTYFLNLTGRRDGSSRFGPDKRFANFGAVGAAWIFTKASFFQEHAPWLSFGKLRASYGTTGNDQIGDYRYLDAYLATPGPGGLYPTQLSNPDFSWEVNKKWEAGLQLGFFNDRINLNLSGYRNRSSNQLVGYPLPAMTGFTSIEANLPATVENKGWEIELSTFNFSGPKFSWQTSFNLSLPENKLLEFPNIEETSYQNTYRVGQPLHLAILYRFEGVDPETGLYTVADVNGDGSYNYDDRIVTKKLGRQYFGGLQNQLSYKGFSLRFLFEFVKQKGAKFSAVPPGRIGNTLPGQVYLGQEPAQSNSLQRASQSIYALLAYNNYAYNSDFKITDASFVRLKTLNIDYSLPKKFLDPLGLSSFTIFLHAQNLFTLTDYIGMDPQNPASKELPALQSFTGGVQLNF